MTDSLDQQVAQLAEKYKQWSIGAGQPGQVELIGQYGNAAVEKAILAYLMA